jgi:transcriptional regulator with XRE-family HTH domain
MSPLPETCRLYAHSPAPSSMDRLLLVRRILETRGLTLYRVTERSAEIFGSATRFHVPHNFYSQIRESSFTPSIEQVLSFSHITNYRLSDWLTVFGFDLDRILGLSSLLLRRRTMRLSSIVYDTQAWIPWFADRGETETLPPMAPITKLLAQAPRRRASEILSLGTSRFEYAVVGDEDCYAFPHFAPGSIVRADPRISLEADFRDGATDNGRFFLVEYELGWTCSRLLAASRNRIFLESSIDPCLRREVRLGSDARVLGVIDAEIRPLSSSRSLRIPVRIGSWKAEKAHWIERPTNLPSFLARARIRSGISFREASEFTRTVAAQLSDELFFTAASTLSDYETISSPPRHIQKILGLCVAYGLGFEELLRYFRVPLELAGNQPITDELLSRGTAERSRSLPRDGKIPEESGRIIGSILEHFEEVPLFLRHFLKQLSGLKHFSPSDVFWVGRDTPSLYPWLTGAALVAVNRRARRPPLEAKRTACRPAIYLMLMRDGSYRCGRCTQEGGDVILHAYPGGEGETRRFQDGVDAEVLGRITAILRKLD